MGDALEEHYSYLSDTNRLARFELAVARAVAAGDSVADIGCGFGVLGLMCLKAGASHVWGIDESPAIEIAREAMARNGLADRYSCLHESSFRVELPQRVDIVICDHVGYFGFDYGIVEAVGDARRRFLKPGGKVVPERITLHVAAAQSSDCRALADAWASAPVPAELHWLREYGVNTKHPHRFAAADLASGPAELGCIDLRGECPAHSSFTAQLEIGRPCELDGLAGWFECDIFAGVSMTNSPLAADRINRRQVFLPFATPLSVVAGDTVSVTVSVRHESMFIAWTARVARTGQSSRQSTWASTILDQQDRIPPAERIPNLSPTGEARRALLALVDGRATNAQIERTMLSEHADLYPSQEQIARFVRSELFRSTR